MNDIKDIIINPTILKGKIKIPPSKSLSHRAIIAGALSKGRCKINNLIYSKDIIATIDIMTKLGAKIKKEKDYVIIDGIDEIRPIKANLFCNESGSTLRFLIPLASLFAGNIEYEGINSLKTRPITPYIDIFKNQNLNFSYDGSLPLILNDSIKAGEFNIKGDISSQFITGLLYTLSLLKENSVINIIGKLESKAYVDLTLDVLKEYGIDIDIIKKDDEYKGFKIKGNQIYINKDYKVEGDYSQGAFFIVLGVLCGDIECLDLKQNSLQADKAVLDIIKKMGAKFEIIKDRVVLKKSKTKGIKIDASNCPDIIPILAVLAALSEGKTTIYNGKRLRIKESDRIKSSVEMLKNLGADVKETDDGMIIYGKDKLNGGQVDSFNDHRIVMSATMASCKCKNPVKIKNYKAIDKSYPSFFEDFKSLGGLTNG